MLVCLQCSDGMLDYFTDSLEVQNKTLTFLNGKIDKTRKKHPFSDNHVSDNKKGAREKTSILDTGLSKAVILL